MQIIEEEIGLFLGRGGSLIVWGVRLVNREDTVDSSQTKLLTNNNNNSNKIQITIIIILKKM